MGRLFRFVVSGSSVAELKDNMSKALDELNGEETTAAPVAQPAPRPGMSTAAGSVNFESESGPMHIPAQPVTPAAPQNLGVDSMGFPWDERIHSSNMGKSKDGSWRARRGVEPAYVKQIEHELISKIKSEGASPAQNQVIGLPPAPVSPPILQALPSAPPVIPFSPVPMGNVFPPPAPLTAPVAVAAPPLVIPTAPSIAIPVAPPPAPIPIQVTSAHTLATFTAQFVPTLSHLVSEGKLTSEYIAALKNYFKLEQIYDATPAQISEMFETFCTAGLLTKVG